jgi:hypothetical protein
VIVKHVASNYDEVRFEVSSLPTKLLERGKSCLADAIAGALLKTSDS